MINVRLLACGFLLLKTFGCSDVETFDVSNEGEIFVNTSEFLMQDDTLGAALTRAPNWLPDVSYSVHCEEKACERISEEF